MKVQLPPGCRGFDCKDGTKYTAAKAGGSVDVSERHADAIRDSQFAGDAHLIGNIGRNTFGTKRGMKCPKCRRIWNVWTKECRHCGVETEEV
jgi:hypothetical protein